MTKRKIEEPTKTELVVKKSDFIDEVNDFCEKGKAIYETEIKTTAELENSERKFNNWKALVEEFLKYAFTNPTNEYLKGFKDSGNFIGVDDVLMRRVNIHEPAYKLQKHKERIDSKLNYLNILIGRLKYIPSQVETSKSFQQSDTFSNEERERLSTKIDDVLSRLHELHVGQEVIFNEIDELKSFLSLDKRNWKQLLKGKLVDIGLSKMIDVDVLNWIYKQLTDENLTLLK